jgi:predicted secreted protein
MSWVGRRLIIRKDGVAIAGARAKSVRFNNDPIDVTYEEEDGFRHFLDVLDTREVVIGIDGVLSAPHVEQLIRPKIEGELIDVEIEFPDESLIAGDAYIQSLQITGEYRNAVTFSASLVISGTFSRSAPFISCGPSAMLFDNLDALVGASTDDSDYQYSMGFIGPTTLEHVTWTRPGQSGLATIFNVGHPDNPHSYPVLKWHRREIDAITGATSGWQELLIPSPPRTDSGNMVSPGNLYLRPDYSNPRLMGYWANTGQPVIITGWLFDQVFYPGPLVPFWGLSYMALSESSMIMDVPGWGVYTIGAGNTNDDASSCGVHFYPRSGPDVPPLFSASAGLHLDSSSASGGTRQFIGYDSQGRIYVHRQTGTTADARIICIAPQLTGIEWEASFTPGVDYVPGQNNSVAANNNFNADRMAIHGDGNLMVAGSPIMSVLDISNLVAFQNDTASTFLGLIYVRPAWNSSRPLNYRSIDRCNVWFPDPANALWNVSADGLAPT